MRTIEHKPTAIVRRSGERVVFRSRLEARWAQFFDGAGLDWKYEPIRFDLGDGVTYTPDFRVSDIGFFEIKPSIYFIRESWDRIEKFISLGGADRVYVIARGIGDPYHGGFVAALHGTPLKQVNFRMLESMLIIGGKQRMELAKETPEMFIDSTRLLMNSTWKLSRTADLVTASEIIMLSDVLPHTITKTITAFQKIKTTMTSEPI